MKKSRIIALLLVVVLAVSMLSACALFGGAGDLKKLLDDEGTFEVKAAASTVTEISSIAGYNTTVDSRGDLVVLSRTNTGYDMSSSSTDYVVYNVKTGTTLKSFTNYSSSGSSHTSVTLLETNDVSYFYTVTASYGSDETNYYTELYDATGYSLDSANKQIAPIEISGTDLVKFDDMYFEAKDGALQSAFQASPFKALPNIIAANDEYYYAKDGNFFAIYDKQFEKLATCEIPDYYEECEYAALPGGDLLIQYSYVVDFFSDKYDVIDTDEMTKYNVVTLILDVKNGKTKDIKCDYIISYAGDVEEEFVTENVLNPKKFEDKIVVTGYKIEDNRLAYEFCGFMNKSGKIEELPEIEGEGVLSIYAVAPDRWVVMTETRNAYLINAECDVLGMIPDDVRTYGDYLVAEGKIYDWSLNLLMDYKAEGYNDEISSIGGNILLTKTYEHTYSYMTYSGYNTSTQTVTDRYIFDGTTELVLDGTQTWAPSVNSYNPSSMTKSMVVVGDCYAIITTTNSYNSVTGAIKSIELFNEDGTSLKSLSNLATVSISAVYDDDDNGMLVKVTSTNPVYGSGYGISNPTNYAYWLVK